MMREIALARQTWDILKPLESNADTISVERHLPTQFQLAPPKPDSGMFMPPGYSSIAGVVNQRQQDIDPVSPHGRSVFQSSSSEDRSRSISHSLATPVPSSPGFRQRLDTPRTEFSSDNLTSSDGATQMDIKTPDPQSSTVPVIETPFSPDSVGTRQVYEQSRIERSTSSVAFNSVPVTRSRTLPTLAQPEKEKSRWFNRSKLTRSRKEPSGDTSSLSSSTLVESQRLEEISLKNLTSASKSSRSGKSGKNISVHLSQNSTHALFWNQHSIHIMDVGNSPPNVIRAISTESTCVLAAVTKTHLAYIIGTRDQKLTVRKLIYLNNLRLIVRSFES